MTRRKSRTRIIERLEARYVLDSTVVFNEVMYHADQEDQVGEWIELHNQMAVDMDLSNWSIGGGVDFKFPDNVTVPGGGFVIVAQNPDDIVASTDLVFGPFSGRISNGGESLELRNRGQRLMDRLEFNDRNGWPVAADGSGATLAKIDLQSGSADWANWNSSVLRGGTPGKINFERVSREPQTQLLVRPNENWRLDDSGADQGIAWRENAFDDSNWQVAEAVIFAGQFDGIAPPGEGGGTEGHSIRLNNPSFEANTNGGVGYGPIDGWDVQGGTGINPARSGSDPFIDNGAVADNQQLAFIQVAGSISQTVDELVPGETHWLQFHYNARDCCGGVTEVTVEFDGKTIMPATLVEPVGQDRPFYFANVPFEPTASTGTFSIKNVGSGGDQSLLLDAVNIVARSDDNAVLANPSFEASGAAVGQSLYLTDRRISGWTYEGDGQFGVTADDAELHDNSRIPEGEAALFLEGAGRVRQFVSNLTSGQRYEVSIRFNARSASPAPALAVAVDGSILDQQVVSAAGNDDYHRMVVQFTAAGSSAELDLVQLAEAEVAPVLFLDSIHVRDVGSPLVSEVEANAPTYYFRTTFDFTGTPSQTELAARTLIDDGAIVYLNGHELFRENMPTGEVNFQTTASTPVSDPALSDWLTVPKDALKVGRNVLAVEVHRDSANDTDMAFGMELQATEVPFDPTLVPSLVINEISGLGNDFSVELFNSGDRELQLKEFQLHVADQVIPLPNQTLPPNEIWSSRLAGITVGMDDNLFLMHDERDIVVDAIDIRETPASRLPDDADTWVNKTTTTFGATNEDQVEDSIVINEIMYHQVPRWGQPDFVESNEEWIELFNRSNQTVDLSGWRLDNAVSFQFQPGTLLDPSEFVVIAKNESETKANHPEARVLGSFSGTLSNDNERIILRDELDNVIDDVHYFDGGRWPSIADGGGASIELIDAWADNNVGEAWMASEIMDNQWHEFSYTATGREPRSLTVPRAFDELIVGLLDDGEVLIDDLQVTEEPNEAPVELIANGDFESDLPGSSPDQWRILGNHHGTVAVDPDDPQNHVLHLRTTGSAEHMSNHAEITLANGADISSSKTYEISYRAKWLSGSPQLNTRLYFNRAAKTTILQTSNRNGSPGAENRVVQSNLGPTFYDLAHQPLVPTSDEPVTVSVAAWDRAGVADAELHFSVDGEAFQTVAMSLADNGRFEATIPPQRRGDVVQFYVSAHDTLGAASQFPSDGSDSGAMYRVTNDSQTSDDVHSVQIIMTDEDASFMHTSWNVMSNDRLPATVIYNDSEVFYDVGVRLRASGYGRRGPLVGFNVQFDPAQLFRGVHQTIALDRGAVFSTNGQVRGQPGASPHELLIYQTAHHAGGIAAMYDDVVRVNAPRAGNSGMALLKMARYSDVFLDSQFDNGSDGTLYKYELIYHATTTTNGQPDGIKNAPHAVLGTDIRNLGDDKEAYRLNWIIKNNRDRDDYDSIIQLGQAFSNRGEALNAETSAIMDLDQWMRTFALLSLVGVADVYNMGLAHNLELFVLPEDGPDGGKVLAFPWDVDHGFFYPTNSPILGRGGSNLQRVINLPNNTRLFHKHLLDIVQTAYNADYLSGWAKHYSAITGFDVEDFFVNYVSNRSEFVLNELNRVAPKIDFQITTNQGNPIQVDQAGATIEGTGWIDVHQVRYGGEILDVVWLDDEKWQVQVPLQPGENQVVLEALDFREQLVGTDAITVTTSIENRPLQDFLRVVEFMYNPPEPSTSELSVNPNWDNDDFEFIELLNISESISLDLGQLRFTSGPSEVLDLSSVNPGTLAPGERVVLVNHLEAFQTRYSDQVRVVGQYTGNLRNSGERIRFEDTDGAAIVDFIYDDVAPWPTSADGEGFSLQLIDPVGTPPNDFDNAQRWRSGFVSGGTPGKQSRDPDFNQDGRLTADDIDAFCNASANEPRFDLDGNGTVDDDDFSVLIEDIFQTSIGDANLDGVFNSRDLVQIFQAGQYQDNNSRNSTWSTGDWNCDREFDTNDLVFAFQRGGYVAT